MNFVEILFLKHSKKETFINDKISTESICNVVLISI